jgi:hypothetical protein
MARTRVATTASHAPGARWRNSRAVGYQGLSSRSDNQRQSGRWASRIHTGLPSAPARCATDVSTVTTRSSAAMAAAMSAKSSMQPGSWRSDTTSAHSAICDSAGPFCSENSDTPSIASGASSRSGIDRCRFAAWPGLPDHTTPTVRRRRGSRADQAATSARSIRRYGTRAGIVGNSVPNANGRLSSDDRHLTRGLVQPGVMISSTPSMPRSSRSSFGCTSSTTRPPRAATSGA